MVVSTLKHVLDEIDTSAIFSTVLFTPNVDASPLTRNLSNNTFTGGILGSLRSMSQVTFVNNALSGTLIMAGCLLSSVQIGLLGLVGVVVPTAVGLLHNNLSVKTASLNGLIGYNGHLLGLGIGFFGGADDDWAKFSILLLPVVSMSVISFYVTVSLKSMFGSFPIFTLPYNIVLSCWLMWTISLGDTSALYPELGAIDMSPISSKIVSFDWFMESSLAGIGQVYFSSSVYPSILIFIGLLIGSPIVALLALLGSVVGTSVAVLAHASVGLTELGVIGLNPVLTAVALGGFYFVPSWISIWMCIVGSLFSITVQSVFSGLFVRISNSGPAMTFPFCITAAVFYKAGAYLYARELVPAFSYPERHLVEYTEGRRNVYDKEGGCKLSSPNGEKSVGYRSSVGTSTITDSSPSHI